MLQIELLPILGDNYAYLLLEPESRTSAVGSTRARRPRCWRRCARGGGTST